MFISENSSTFFISENFNTFSTSSVQIIPLSFLSVSGPVASLRNLPSVEKNWATTRCYQSAPLRRHFGTGRALDNFYSNEIKTKLRRIKMAQFSFNSEGFRFRQEIVFFYLRGVDACDHFGFRNNQSVKDWRRVVFLCNHVWYSSVGGGGFEGGGCAIKMAPRQPAKRQVVVAAKK